MDEVALQGSASGVLLPAKPAMSAYQVLNWIAFRRAVEHDLTTTQQFKAEFYYPPSFEWGGEAFDYATAEAANSLTVDHHAKLSRAVKRLGKQPRDLAPARAMVQRLIQERGCSPEKLRDRYLFCLDICRQGSERFRAAQDELVDMLAAERLRVMAMRGDAPAVVVPWTEFHTHSAHIESWGEIYITYDLRYQRAQFLTAEVLALWSEPAAQSTATITEPVLIMPATAAMEWMRSNVTGPGQWKRDGALRACMDAVGVTYRDALAAWNDLPAQLRGLKGVRKQADANRAPAARLSPPAAR